jgi:hypothetical protein
VHTARRRHEGSFLLAVQIAGAAQGPLLFIGSGVLADSLAKMLSSQGMTLLRAASDHAIASARAHSPSLVVVAGDAARDRGLSIRSRFEQENKENPLPVLVILAPELGGLALQPLPRHVGYLAPTGGVNECAKRVQALFELFMDVGLTNCSLQQLADTVSSKGKPAANGDVAPAAEPTATPAKAERKPTVASAVAPAASSGTSKTPKQAPAPRAVPVRSATIDVDEADFSSISVDLAASSATGSSASATSSKAAPPPLRPSKAAAEPAAVSGVGGATSKAAPPPLKPAATAAAPDNLEIAVQAAAEAPAVSQSNAAPPPLKVTQGHA